MLWRMVIPTFEEALTQISLHTITFIVFFVILEPIHYAVHCAVNMIALWHNYSQKAYTLKNLLKTETETETLISQ